MDFAIVKSETLASKIPQATWWQKIILMDIPRKGGWNLKLAPRGAECRVLTQHARGPGLEMKGEREGKPKF